jgi:hypothetical protein
MHTTAEGLPMTHAIAAARSVAGGDPLSGVQTPVLVELGIGLLYLFAGLALLRFFEAQGRRSGALDRA